MAQERLDVIIDNDKNFIEITAEGSDSTLHVEGTRPNPQFLGKVIGNYLIQVAEEAQEEEPQQ